MPTPIPPTPLKPTPLKPTPLPRESGGSSRVADAGSRSRRGGRRPTAPVASHDNRSSGGRSRRRTSRRRKSRSHGEGSFGPSRLAQFVTAAGWKTDRLGAATDVCLLACIAVVPWIMGGRIALGHAAFLTLSLAAACFLCVRAVAGRGGIRIGKLDLLMAAGVGLVATQALPVPAAAVSAVSPKISQLLPLHGSETSVVSLPQWNRLTLAPDRTFHQLGLLVAGMLFFVTARCRIDSPQRIRSAFWAVSGVGAAIAAFGVAQYMLDNGRFFWFYDYPYTSTEGRARGPFSNPNHYAGVAVVASVWPLWMLIAPGRRKKDDFGKISPWPARMAVAILSVTLPAIFLSQSRSGLVTMGVAVATVFVLGRWAGGANSGRRLAVSGLALAGVALASLVAFGSESESQVEQNLLELTSGDIEQVDANSGRRNIWTTAVRGFLDFPVLGAGLGAHQSIYLHYWDWPAKGKLYSHVENGPLQVLLETGSAGGAVVFLLMIALSVMGLRTFRREESFRGQKVVAGAFLAVLASHFVHTLTDFVWHSPGNMLLILTIGAAGAAAYGVRSTAAGPSSGSPAGRAGGLIGLSAVAATALLFVPETLARVRAEPHLFETVRLRAAAELEDAADVRDTKSQQLAELLKARTYRPADPQLNARLAKLLLWAFDRRQRDNDRFDLANLRDTARGFASAEEATQFFANPSVAGTDFQVVAMARSLALTGLRGDPLQVDCWRRLIATQFTADVSDAATQPLIEQLLTVQPHSAIPHYEAANACVLRGDVDGAVDHWMFAFRQDESAQLLVSVKLAAVLPVERLLETLEPDAAALNRIQGVYDYVGRPDDENILRRTLGQRWEIAAAEGATANGASAETVQMLRRSCIAYRAGDDLESAERTARRAVQISPTSITARSALGEVLRERQQWAEAAEHLIWCSRMDPDDIGLRERAELCLKYSRTRESLIASPELLPIR